MPTSPGQKRERDLMMIYTKLQEDYNWFSQELTLKSLNPKMGSHLLFIGRRKKSLNQLQVKFRNSSDPIVGRLIQVCGRPTDRPHKLQDLLKMAAGRPIK